MATLTRLARAGFSLEEEELPAEMKRPLPPRRLFIPVTTTRASAVKNGANGVM